MQIENQTTHSPSPSITLSQTVYEQFNSLNVLFLALTTYTKFENLERYAENILDDLNKVNEYFLSLPIFDAAAAASLSPKEKVIAAKTIDLLAEFIPILEKYIADPTMDISSNLNKATLQLSLMKAFSYYPASSQNDLIYLGQFSAMFSQHFSSPDLSFSLPTLEEALADPKAFGEHVETLSILTPTFHAVMPHIPQDSPYKAQLTSCHQNLFHATFKAKMLLNQINFGQKEAIDNSVKVTLEAYKHFLDHIELPF